jgi:hypothetical protein
VTIGERLQASGRVVSSRVVSSRVLSSRLVSISFRPGSSGLNRIHFVPLRVGYARDALDAESDPLAPLRSAG